MRNKDAFLATLFQPVNGRTADGYVSKRTPSGVVVWLANKEFMINLNGVWCNMSKLENGRTLYSHAVIDEHLNLYLGYMAQHSAAKILLEGGDYLSHPAQTEPLGASVEAAT